MTMKGLIVKLNRRLRRLLTKRSRRVATFSLEYRIQVHDPEGNLVSDTGPRKSHSFTLQFLQQIEVLMTNSGLSGVLDITNTARQIGHVSGQANKFLFVQAAAGVTDTGIVVGTGTGAESDTDYKLGTLIAHGTGAGEFQWEAHAYTTTGRVGGNVDYEQRRTYTNGSGGSITIEEIGMYVDTFDSGEASQHFCILRDLTGGVAVADTYTASVKYTLRTTV